MLRREIGSMASPSDLAGTVAASSVAAPSRGAPTSFGQREARGLRVIAVISQFCPYYRGPAGRSRSFLVDMSAGGAAKQDGVCRYGPRPAAVKIRSAISCGGKPGKGDPHPPQRLSLS